MLEPLVPEQVVIADNRTLGECEVLVDNLTNELAEAKSTIRLLNSGIGSPSERWPDPA